MTFIKDWRGLIPSLLWSWIICWIPSIWVAITIAMTHYRLHDSTLEWQHGVINQQHTMIDLYRVRNISSTINLISGGRVFITYDNGESLTLPYIKNANQVATQLREIVNEKRKEQGVNPIEFMA